MTPPSIEDCPLEVFNDLDDNEPDYCAESWKDRFRRQNPTWTEEEIEEYINRQHN